MFDINSQYGRIAISCNFIAISYRFIFVTGKPLSSTTKIMMNKKLDAKILTQEFFNPKYSTLCHARMFLSGIQNKNPS